MNLDFLEVPQACPVCESKLFSRLLETPTHMHSSVDTFSFSLCDSCASVFLNPRIKASRLQTYYPSTYLPYRGMKAWGKYGPFVAWRQRGMDIRRAKTCFTYFSPQSAISILDIGCGRPTFLDALGLRTNWMLNGIDFSTNGWDTVNLNRITLIEGDMRQTHFNGLFDIVTMWHYLEHDYHPRDTIRAVRKIMPISGKLIIEIPDYRSITARLQKEYWEGWHAPRHATLCSQQGLSALLQQQGFKIVDYYRYGTLDAFTLWWMGTMEKKGIDWSQSMENEFVPLMVRMIYTAPLFFFEKIVPMGIQTIVAEAI